MKKYWYFFKIDFLQGIYHKGAVFGRFGFFGIVLYVFSQLWKIVLAKTPLDLGPRDMLWYLAMTELIVLSFPLIHIEIEEDVSTGNLSYFLTRPVSYLWSRYARAFGNTLARFFILMFAGITFAYLFSGGFPSRVDGIHLFFPLAILSIAVCLLYQVTIGIISFWIQDSSPLYWVWQKCNFVLGGMILPLDIYPDWLKQFALLTPFSAILYGPAKAAITNDFDLALDSFLKLLLWGGIGITISVFTFSRARNQLTINGG